MVEAIKLDIEVSLPVADPDNIESGLRVPEESILTFLFARLPPS